MFKTNLRYSNKKLEMSWPINKGCAIKKVSCMLGITRTIRRMYAFITRGEFQGAWKKLEHPTPREVKKRMYLNLVKILNMKWDVILDCICFTLSHSCL